MILGAFLMAALIASLVGIPLMRFKVKRGYGGFLIAFYVVFLVIAILTETGIILDGFEHVTYI